MKKWGICRRCGNWIVIKSPNHKYCANCRKILTRERQKEYFREHPYCTKLKPKPKKDTLAEKVVKARMEGVSYGTYVAQETIEQFARVKL